VPSAVPGVPPGWLDLAARGAATDLDLAILLINSYDGLEDPPDRLHDLTWFTGVLRGVGHDEIAGQLRNIDLPALRELRSGLRDVFEAADDARAAAVLNPMLINSGALPLLVDDGHGSVELAVAPDREGLAALVARLPAALASYVATHGVRRLGTCAAGPCSCAFVDRTRGRSRRYCCTYCNDRAAARSYRARKRNG
jgi:predicted RNA-binding Zn ribbon-like protein